MKLRAPPALRRQTTKGDGLAPLKRPLKRESGGELERTRSARAENIGLGAGRHSKSGGVRTQIVAVPAQVGDVENVETLADQGELGALGPKPEYFGHADILRGERTGERPVRRQHNGGNHARGSGRSGVGLIKLIDRLNQRGLSHTDAELVVADAGKRRPAGFSVLDCAVSVQVHPGYVSLDRPHALERGDARNHEAPGQVNHDGSGQELMRGLRSPGSKPVAVV